MKFTNKQNLPDAIFRAVTNDPYDHGNSDFTATGLIKPPRIRALELIHSDQITEDASDRIWALIGQSVHSILERAESTEIAEKRFFMSVDGYKVSAQLDRLVLVGGVIQDYKAVTAWKFKGDDAPIEYVQQLNIQAQVCRANGHKIEKLQVVGILRDWSKLQAARDANYPQSQVVVRDIQLWPESTTMAFIRHRISSHKQAEKNLPECSDEDRWARPNVYAVMKKGRKSAVRLHETEESARKEIDFLDKNRDVFSKQHKLETRPGENIRCEHYCPVSKFCEQFKNLKGKDEPK